MRSYRNNPEGEANQAASKQHEREVFALKMQAKRHSISPYPASVRIKNIADGAQVFDGGKFIGEVQHLNNWGNDWLARPLNQRRANQFHASKTEAVNFLLQTHKEFP